jgi:HEAT repeat protein
MGVEEARSISAHPDELSEHGDEILTLLTNVVIHDGHQPARQQARALAIRILGHLQLDASLGHLGAVLDDPAEPASQRAAAADAIGLIGDQASAKVLRLHLDDPNPLVRRTAAIALGDIAPPKAEKWLRRQLRDESDASVRKSLQLAIDSVTGTDGVQPDSDGVEEVAENQTRLWSPPLMGGRVTLLP